MKKVCLKIHLFTHLWPRLQEASPHISKLCRSQKFDLALARWLVAAGGWSSETINHRNAARWSWMVPSQPSLAASPGPANFAGKTFQQNLPFAASVHSDGDTESPS